MLEKHEARGKKKERKKEAASQSSSHSGLDQEQFLKLTPEKKKTLGYIDAGEECGQRKKEIKFF